MQCREILNKDYTDYVQADNMPFAFEKLVKRNKQNGSVYIALERLDKENKANRNSRSSRKRINKLCRTKTHETHIHTLK